MRIGLCYVCRLTPVHSWTVFLVAVEYFQEESLWVLPRCRTCTGLKRNENSMSGRNGDRSRFHRQRRAKLHNRTRIRELRKTLTAQEAGSEPNRNLLRSTLEGMWESIFWRSEAA